MLTINIFRNIFNAISTILLSFLMVSMFVFTAPSYAALRGIGSSADTECSSYKNSWQSFDASKFIGTDVWSQQTLSNFFISICKGTRDKRISYEEANKWLLSVVTYYGYCDKSNVRQNYTHWLEEKNESKQIINIYSKYCRDTFDPSSKARTTRARLLDNYDWLRAEIFCQRSRTVTDPGGWEALTRPDLASLEKLKVQSISLCEKVREGTITVDEGEYRFKQEALWMREHIGPEVLKEFGRRLRDLSKELIDLFKK